MSTRANVVIKKTAENGNVSYAQLYHHHDGYCSGVGKDLSEYMAEIDVMSDEEKKISDQKSIQLFGMDNETHFLTLVDEYDPFASKDINEKEVSNWNDIRKIMI